MTKEIILSKGDYVMLTSFIKNHASGFSAYSLEKLAGELQTAKVVSTEELPEDVVRLYSEIEVTESGRGEKIWLKLVMPAEADIKENKVSIFAPLGAALIGYRKGDVVEWEVPSGSKKYQILNVKNQYVL